MSYSKKEREEYNKHREHTSKELGLDKNKYNALRRAAHKMSKADTNYANGTTGGEPKYQGNKIVNEYSEKHHSKDTNEAFKGISKLAKKMKLNLYHQGDPRGASLYAGKSRMSSKDYNSKGHVIY